jgi:CubicO group peptidase (beta-lactamase class C family)
MRRSVRPILKFLLLMVVSTVLILVCQSLSIISGYGAKVVCSGIFVAGRDKDQVISEDLASFPLNLSSITVDEKDSSVSATVWGLAKRKAIYRRGLGATLVSGLTEKEIREQRVDRVVAPVVNQDSVDWPMGDRRVMGIETGAMKAAVGLAFGWGGKATGTRAVVVVHHGRILSERYAPGFDRTTRLAGWSMTKGIINAFVGILVGQGKLDVQKAAPVEKWSNDDRQKIRIDDLLHMRSGLSWWELYAGPGAATRMLFEEANMGKYAEGSSLRHPPGEVFNYSSGTANILSAIIRSRIDSGYYRWPYERLFYKIGMYSALLEPDAGGTFVGSSYCYATARDWARFGLLYLWDGVWLGKRLLPEGWVKYTRTGKKYGALWWLNGDEDGRRRYEGVPGDCFSCEGYEGQYLWVIPSKDLVIVRLAMEHGNRLKAGVFLQRVIKALPAASK